jgi:drug/metabolite transporter (DMT)-like permease
MNWLLLTAISVVSRAIYGVMTKVLSDKVRTSVYTQATLLSLAGAMIALVVSPFFGGLMIDFINVSLLAVLLVIMGQGLGNVTYFAAIKNLTNGTAQIAFSSILVFNTVLALVFFDLHLSFINVFGLILLMLAILSVVNGKIELDSKGISLMVLSAFFFAIFQLASAELSKQVGAATYLVIAYGGAAAVVFVMRWRVIIYDLRLIEDMKTAFGVPFLTVIPSLGNFLFAYYAYRIAPQPAKVAMLLTSQVVFAVLLSYFLLNEKSHLWKKITAAILVVIAAILIKE